MEALIGKAAHGEIVGTGTDATMAALGVLPTLSEDGCFRKVYGWRDVVYKVARWGDDNAGQMREWAFMLDLAWDRCEAGRLYTPTTLWRAGDTLVTAQPMLMDRMIPHYMIRDLARIVRNHNAHGHAPIIADLREGNYMLDRHGNLRITDGNLDPFDYTFLVETETTGRLAGRY